MKISVLIGGGVGDMMLSMRHLAAIRERYSSSYITLYINDKGIRSYSAFIEKHWNYLFDNLVIVEIKDLKFRIRSQFGEEEYYNAYNNITEEFRRRIEDCDKFYNIIPDGVYFVDYQDIPWIKYQRFIPLPKNTPEPKVDSEGCVVLNLYARDSSPSAISKEFSDAIIKEVSSINRVIILAPDENAKNTFYSEFKEMTVVANLDESLSIISNCRVGVSVDTGIRCMFHAFGKSCYTMSVNCSGFFECPPQYEIRWYPWKENLIPLNASPLSIKSLVNNALKHSGCELFPLVNPDFADNLLIKRILHD